MIIFFGSMPRTLAIGDIHGCSTALQALIEEIRPRPDDTIVVLGDFIDCGPDSRGVVEQLIALADRCRLVRLLGNHEEMLLNALESRSELRYWLKLGGQQTLDSYGAYRPAPELIPAEHIRFIRGCQEYFETGAVAPVPGISEDLRQALPWSGPESLMPVTGTLEREAAFS
jgi:serine/threonine protein phosphatase 1